MVNLLYPRIISIRRSRVAGAEGSTPQGGLVGYAGREQSIAVSNPEGEIVLFTGIPANIIAKSEGRTMGFALPSDIAKRTIWQILIPITALPQYSIRDRDIIVDDENYRYGVDQNFWTILGYQLSAVRMEA